MKEIPTEKPDKIGGIDRRDLIRLMRIISDESENEVVLELMDMVAEEFGIDWEEEVEKVKVGGDDVRKTNKA